MYKLKIFVVVSMLYAFCGASCFAQQGLKPLPRHMGLHQQPVLSVNPIIPKQDNNVSFIPQNYYAAHLAFFCRQELKMQQVHVPLVFRVGSMEECNYLEQKNPPESSR